MKIYVGCALTRATEEYRQGIAKFKEMLRSKNYEVIDFIWVKLKDPRDVTPQKVYEWDIEDCVANCDLMVAICDEPSIGLGYEIGTAVEKLGKPVLALIKKGIPLTRLIEGIKHPKFSYREYENFGDALELVEEKIKNI